MTIIDPLSFFFTVVFAVIITVILLALMVEFHYNNNNNNNNRWQGQKNGVTTTDSPKRRPGVVGIFWDYDSVPIPKKCFTSTATEWIVNTVTKYGRIVEKRLYYDSRKKQSETPTPPFDFDSSGYTLIDYPSSIRRRNNNGMEEKAYNKLIVDVLCFVLDRTTLGAETITVVLVTSDVTYTYALARLRDMGVFTVVIIRCDDDDASKVLTDSANCSSSMLSWTNDTSIPPVVVGNDDDDDDDDVNPSAVMNRPSTSPLELKELKVFCSAIMDAQSDKGATNDRMENSPCSSWVPESQSALTYYNRMGKTDRDGYNSLRVMATQKGLIEWGRRNYKAAGNPVVKVEDRDARMVGLSTHVYLRLTQSGLQIVRNWVFK